MRSAATWATLLVFGLLGAGPTGAHELDMTTVGLSWRDGHAEARVHLDVRLVQEALALRQEREPSAVSLEDVRKLMTSKSRLLVDGKAVPFVLSGLLTAGSSAALAQSGAHHEATTLLYRAAEVHPEAKTVAIVLPPECGAVLVSFTKPRAQAVRPGTPASFVIRPQAGANHLPAGQTSADRMSGPPVETGARTGIAVGAALLAVLGLALHFRRTFER